MRDSLDSLVRPATSTLIVMAAHGSLLIGAEEKEDVVGRSHCRMFDFVCPQDSSADCE